MSAHSLGEGESDSVRDGLKEEGLLTIKLSTSRTKLVLLSSTNGAGAVSVGCRAYQDFLSGEAR